MEEKIHYYFMQQNFDSDVVKLQHNRTVKSLKEHIKLIELIVTNDDLMHSCFNEQDWYR